jgi:ribosomal protein S18 acetylase RimI-like enzyme
LTPDSIVERIERYYDAVPRSACRVEEHGPLVLFVNLGAGWPYYARPRPGDRSRMTARHVGAVRARQRQLGLPEAFEWVAEVTPSLRPAAEAAGLHVHEHPLLVLDRDSWRPAPPPEGVELRRLAPDAPDLGLARTVANLAFAEAGTAAGETGRPELVAAAAHVDEAALGALRDRLRRRLTVMVAAGDGDGPLSVGSHNPVGPVTEIVGVGTLPAARRRGLGAAVTSELVEDAVAGGADVVFLSAADEDVARLYGRLGFRRAATALIAEPGPPAPQG